MSRMQMALKSGHIKLLRQSVNMKLNQWRNGLHNSQYTIFRCQIVENDLSESGGGRCSASTKYKH